MLPLKCRATVVASKPRPDYEQRGEMVKSKTQDVVVIDPDTVETETLRAPLAKDDRPVVFEVGREYDFTVQARAYDRFSGPVIVYSITDYEAVGAGSSSRPASTENKGGDAKAS